MFFAQKHNMKIIGITGGIASGKSTVTKMFEKLGATVLSADLDARAVLAPNTLALASVFTLFPETRKTDGTLDRSALAQRIFTSSEDKSRLEAITHPAIIARMENAIYTARGSGNDGLLFYEVPLLYERNLAYLFDAVVAVLATPALQAERLQARESAAGRRPLSEQEVTNRLASQMPPEAKAARAFSVVRTDTTLDAAEKQVREIWTKLKSQ